MTARSIFAVLCAAAALQLIGCDDDITPALTEWCPDDPTVQWCPQGDCPGPYQCLSYCIVHHPDGGDVPDVGMGAWCDDSRLPEYGAFCLDHLEDVSGCSAWCEAHPGRCTAGSDGDADTDADTDTDVDSDADVDEDADPDADPDPEPECTTDDQCLAIGEAQCDPGTGTCVACSDDTHCAHLPGTPACEGGVCHACTATNETACTGETPHCLAAEHLCVSCADDAHCPEVTAARCDATTHTCEPCADDGPCARLTDTPHCDAGTCVQCTSYAHCLEAGRVCNYSTKLCVEACRACTTSTDCESLGAGFVCDDDWITPSLRHCFQQAATCERPWVRSSPGGVCVPPPTTTCLGVMEFGSGCDPFAPGPCGDDGIPSDADCIEGATNYCSFYCTDTAASSDCPEGTTCSGVPLACRLP